MHIYIYIHTCIYYGICIYTWGFPGGSAVKNPSANAEDTAFIPGSGRFPWRRKWQPTSVFLPKNSMDRIAWRATAYGVAKSQTRLNN